MSRRSDMKYSSGQNINITDDEEGFDLATSSPVVHMGDDPEPVAKRATRGLITLTFLVLGLLAGVYVMLAATVMVIMDADPNKALVLRNAYTVGQVPQGAVVYASSAPVDYSFMGKVNESIFGVPAGSVVEVVAGPTDEVRNNKDGFIIVNGNLTRYQGKVDNMMLGREYVAVCLSGACDTGKAVLVSQYNVIGGVKKYVGFDGIRDVTPAAGLSR